ncbi:ABC transporter ATP-binding protein [Atopobacter phocae]|uniref:ABC transporter ATP-binding protein n=1 Tax=Atopobacter phocae TaxID=136492 RepID=UPI000472C046|nr:ABC transporter ATP-binding protein [Atopobacter phocae]
MSYIALVNESKHYKNGETITRANEQVNFEIKKGEFVVILGPSGAGKSTILNILGGMDQPTSGEVWVNGKNIATFNDNELTKYRRHEVGFIFQNYNLVPNLTARENVELAAEITKSAANIDEVLGNVGLKDKADHFPAQLSGGEQQRVSIARAVAKQPSLLLCDEPTGALDFETGKQVLSLLQETCRTTGTTVVLITHNQQIAKMAHHVLHILNGQVEEDIYNETPLDVEQIEW